MDKAECEARGIPWPLGECISGGGDYVPHPSEDQFDFPCSATWRDHYMGAPEERRSDPVKDQHAPHVQFIPARQPAKIVLEVPPRQSRTKGVEL